MFKAKLIENESYYKLRSRQLLLMLLPAILIGLLVNFLKFPIWVTIALIGIYVFVIVLFSKNQKRINLILGNKLVHIDNEEIKIISKKGQQLEVIRLAEIDKLILKKKYSIPQETIKEVGSELSGITKENYLIIYQNSESRKLDFILDSYYMIEQLNKTIKNWEDRGYHIEREDL